MQATLSVMTSIFLCKRIIWYIVLQWQIKTNSYLSLNKSRLGDFVDHIYPTELEIKDTTDTDRYVSFLDLHHEIDSEGRLRRKLYGKRDYFNFPIVNFPFICSKIPAAPAYGVDISRLIRYSRACCSYQHFLDRGLLLTRKLLNQGFLLVKLKSPLLKVLPLICSTCRKDFLVLSLFMTYHRVFKLD
jgi:hypothetical protein